MINLLDQLTPHWGAQESAQICIDIIIRLKVGFQFTIGGPIPVQLNNTHSYTVTYV